MAIVRPADIYTGLIISIINCAILAYSGIGNCFLTWHGAALSVVLGWLAGASGTTNGQPSTGWGITMTGISNMRFRISGIKTSTGVPFASKRPCRGIATRSAYSAAKLRLWSTASTPTSCWANCRAKRNVACCGGGRSDSVVVYATLPYDSSEFALESKRCIS